MLEPRRVFQRLIVPPVSLGASKRTSLVAKAETRVLHQHVLSLYESWSPTISLLSPSRSFGPDVCNRLSPQTHPALVPDKGGYGGVMFTFQLSNVSLCAIISICII